ncbi:MAG: histidinol-phosphatase HisJ family protein [Clostridiaceae bacterium]|jgi:histidinol-phosphatase (PHP family)|nr:histidinol-phosphatase HisJ family protein [Eubacteriales bacterium]NLV48640.1 histidinol-phosphatase HisJ family protein [Clostridiaceae bacterium]
MLIDHHTHTSPFSFDGRQSPEELLKAAMHRHLDGVCVTDHYEKDIRYIEGVEAIFDMDAYAACLKQLKRLGESMGLMVLYGIELGYLPHLSEIFRQRVLRYPFDVVISSVHILDAEDPYVDDFIYRYGKQMLYCRYFEQLTEMTRNGPDFDILGHFDYICRYAPWQDRKVLWSEHANQLDELIKSIIDTGRTLEINTATVAKLRQNGYSVKNSWPDEAIMRRYLEAGGTQICLCSDAHEAPFVGRYFAEGIEWLKSLGFKYLTHYVGRQPVMTPL